MIVAVLPVTVLVWYWTDANDIEQPLQYRGSLHPNSLFITRLLLHPISARSALVTVSNPDGTTRFFPFPYPSSFLRVFVFDQLAQHSFWPRLLYMSLYGEHLISSSSLVEQLLGWLKGWRGFTSIREGLDAYSRCLNLQSIVLLLFLPSITWRQMYLPHILTQWVSIPLPHHFLVSAHDVHALALC